MIDDDRIRETLLDSGLADIHDLAAFNDVAERGHISLYRAVLMSGRVDETELVAHLAAAMETPSVLLENFGPKPQLTSLLPVEVVREFRLLPVGLKPRDGEDTLFVAMEDPTNLNALSMLGQKFPEVPVVPLLAGPLDLDAAIARVYPNAPPPMPGQPRSIHEVVTGPQVIEEATLSALSNADIFAEHALDSIERIQPSDMHSALSLLDDIPRNRHEEITSPTGFDVVMPLNDSGAAVSVSPFGDVRAPRSTLNDTAAPRTGYLQSKMGVPMGHAEGWRARPARQVLEALISVLVDKGLVTEAEIDDALER